MPDDAGAIKLSGQTEALIEAPMSPKERRAYRFGYLRAMRRARKELDAMAQRWDNELCRIDGEQRPAREQVARSIDDELDGVRAEMKGMRDEFHRLKAIEEAVAVERDFDTLLN